MTISIISRPVLAADHYFVFCPALTYTFNMTTHTASNNFPTTYPEK